MEKRKKPPNMNIYNAIYSELSRNGPREKEELIDLVFQSLNQTGLSKPELDQKEIRRVLCEWFIVVDGSFVCPKIAAV